MCFLSSSVELPLVRCSAGLSEPFSCDIVAVLEFTYISLTLEAIKGFTLFSVLSHDRTILLSDHSLIALNWIFCSKESKTYFITLGLKVNAIRSGSGRLRDLIGYTLALAKSKLVVLF